MQWSDFGAEHLMAPGLDHHEVRDRRAPGLRTGRSWPASWSASRSIISRRKARTAQSGADDIQPLVKQQFLRL